MLQAELKRNSPSALPLNSAEQRDANAYSWLLVLSVLGVSQALSPFPFLLASAVFVYLLSRARRSVRIPYLTLGVVASALVVIAQSFDLDVGTLVRLLASCFFVAVGASLNLRQQQQAFAVVRRLVVVSLALSAIGFVYALAGGSPLYSLENPDGREALLFLTTLSNSVFPTPIGSVIRPSSIYDEPGAYAFVIDFVLIANYLVRRRLERSDWILIVAGLLTFSVAHMIVAVLIAIAERKTVYVVLAAALVACLDLYLTFASGVSLVLDRFSVVDGAIAGDNRSELFKTALTILLDDATGVGRICKWTASSCYDTFGPFGENPMFPAAFFGAASSMLYYLIIALMLGSIVVSPTRRHVLSVLAVVALIAQRPFLFNLGYNLLIVFLFYLIMASSKDNSWMGRRKHRGDVLRRPQAPMKSEPAALP